MRELTSKELWHRRLGHASMRAVARTADVVTGMHVTPESNSKRPCPVCILGKHSRHPFPAQTQFMMHLCNLFIWTPLVLWILALEKLTTYLHSLTSSPVLE
jgi:hypothetical protein